MTQTFDDNGNMTTVVGDSIVFEVSGVPTDLDYTAFFRVYDKNNNTIIPEVSIPCNFNDTITVEVTPDITDMVDVPTGKKSVTHFYGIKACNFENQVEHTLTVGDNENPELNVETKITFMRKRAEGYQVYATLYEWKNGTTSVYTMTSEPSVGDTIYTSTGTATTDTVASVTEVYSQIAGITVGTTYYDRQLQGSYPWNNDTITIYTYTYPPVVGGDVYDGEGNKLEDTISAISTSNNKVDSITVDSVEYTREIHYYAYYNSSIQSTVYVKEQDPTTSTTVYSDIGEVSEDTITVHFAEWEVTNHGNLYTSSIFPSVGDDVYQYSDLSGDSIGTITSVEDDYSEFTFTTSLDATLTATFHGEGIELTDSVYYTRDADKDVIVEG